MIPKLKGQVVGNWGIHVKLYTGAYGHLSCRHILYVFWTEVLQKTLVCGVILTYSYIVGEKNDRKRDKCLMKCALMMNDKKYN